MLRRKGLIAGVVLFAALPALSPAAEIKIAFSTLEKVIAETAFTEEGRRYVKGDKKAKCSFAYLERPEIRGKDGRILIKALFTGRSALNMFGQCVGLGDAFDLEVTGLPYYASGLVALKDVVVGTKRDGLYIRKVRFELAKALTKPFDYKVGDDIKRLLEQSNSSPFRIQINRFDVNSMSVADDGVVLNVDFTMLVK